MNVGVTNGYWHIWHLYSSGVVYCALGMPHIECTGNRWRELHPHLPARDRYAQSKVLQTTVAYMEIRGEIHVLPGSDRLRLLYSRYLPWSSRPDGHAPDYPLQTAESRPHVASPTAA